MGCDCGQGEFVNRAFDARGGFFDVVEGGGQGRGELSAPSTLRDQLGKSVVVRKLTHTAPSQSEASTGQRIPIQHVAHFARELVGIEGLGEKTHAGFAPVMGMERFLQVTGDENDFCLWAGLVQPVGDMAAADFGHHHIGQEQIDLFHTALR